MMKRVLIISYTFPPVGGAGVQRIAKFVKYLPRHGWRTSVLTASNASVPLFDQSLCNEIPSETLIERVPTWEPSYALKSKVAAGENGHAAHNIQRAIKSLVRSSANLLLQPDPQILWAPNAIRRGRQMLREKRHDAVLATGPPFSSFLIGAHLSRRMGLPLILDYRDEWDISNEYWENRSVGGMSHRVQQHLQGKVLRQANAVLATTQASAEQIRNVARLAGSNARVCCIYNGFDPDDFTHFPIAPPRSRYRITYVGTLWRLTTIEPVVEAIRRVSAKDASAAARLELTIAGRRTAEQDCILDRLKSTQCRLTRHDYLSHDNAIRLMNDSDRLCLLLSDSLNAGRVVPAKIFEYMAIGRPLLTLAPNGEVWTILENHPDAGLHLPTDIDGVAASLEMMSSVKRNRAANRLSFDASKYTRIKQAGQLADVLNLTLHRTSES